VKRPKRSVSPLPYLANLEGMATLDKGSGELGELGWQEFGVL